MMSTATERPNILGYLAPFDHYISCNPHQPFATYALSPNVYAVKGCHKKLQTTRQYQCFRTILVYFFHLVC